MPPPDLPGSTVNAARQVDGNDGHALSVDPFNYLHHLFRQIAREPCAEECIDDNISKMRHERSKRIYRAIPQLPCTVRIARKGGGRVAEGENGNVRTALGKR